MRGRAKSNPGKVEEKAVSERVTLQSAYEPHFRRPTGWGLGRQIAFTQAMCRDDELEEHRTPSKRGAQSGVYLYVVLPTLRARHFRASSSWRLCACEHTYSTQVLSPPIQQRSTWALFQATRPPVECSRPRLTLVLRLRWRKPTPSRLGRLGDGPAFIMPQYGTE